MQLGIIVYALCFFLHFLIVSPSLVSYVPQRTTLGCEPV